MSERTEIKYQEHSLSGILIYFVSGFHVPYGAEIIASEWFIDQTKDNVIIRLTVRHEAKP